MRKFIAATVMYAVLGLIMLGIFGVAVWASADDCIHYYMCAPTYDTCCVKDCAHEGWGAWLDYDSWFEMIGLGGIKYCCYHAKRNGLNVVCPSPPHFCTDAKYDMAIGACPPPDD